MQTPKAWHGGMCENQLLKGASRRIVCRDQPVGGDRGLQLLPSNPACSPPTHLSLGSVRDVRSPWHIVNHIHVHSMGICLILLPKPHRIQPILRVKPTAFISSFTTLRAAPLSFVNSGEAFPGRCCLCRLCGLPLFTKEIEVHLMIKGAQAKS